MPLPCRLFPLHIPTALKSDLFSSENVKWPKQGRKGGLFVRDPTKKGPVTGARPPPGHFTWPLDADFGDLGEDRRGSTGPDRGQLVEPSTQSPRGTVPVRVNWPRSEGQLVEAGSCRGSTLSMDAEYGGPLQRTEVRSPLPSPSRVNWSKSGSTGPRRLARLYRSPRPRLEALPGSTGQGTPVPGQLVGAPRCPLGQLAYHALGGSTG